MYGDVAYSSADARLAWNHNSIGNDLIVNNDDGYIYAMGRCSVYNLFVAKINPINGYLVLKKKFGVPTQYNVSGNLCTGVDGKSICESPSGTEMFLGATLVFPTGPQFHRASVYAIDQNLALLTTSGWGTLNPVVFSENSVRPSSNIYSVEYHSQSHQILAGIINNCVKCSGTGANSGDGKVFRVSAADGTLSLGTNPSSLGHVRAYDLRLGVVKLLIMVLPLYHQPDLLIGRNQRQTLLQLPLTIVMT